jgi:UDPglucose 6-dehydrogenase
MRLSIIGAGHVGLITGVVFAQKGNEVLCIDNNLSKIKMLKEKRMPIYEPGLEQMVIKNMDLGRLGFSSSIKEAVDFGRIIFVSVGTPPTPDGYADLSYVEAVSREIAQNLSEYRLIVEKSTVPVKTGEKVKATIARYARKGVEFDVASNPEFLREGSAIEDALSPDRIVIGVDTRRAEELLKELYAPFDAPLIVTSINSAELIKHASNSFLAMKISFINAVASICELSGADIIEVAKGIGMDKRIGPLFLNAGIGYGGFCFPKDIEAFISISKELGFDFKLLREVQNINILARERFVRKVQEELWVLKDKNIGALGLSFKPDTDDIRESAAIAILQMLKRQGAILQVYDPKAMENAKEVLGDVRYCKDPYEVARDADCLLLLTEWEEFKRLDFEKIKSLMRQPILIDGRNLFDPGLLRSIGFIYRSIGRP